MTKQELVFDLGKLHREQRELPEDKKQVAFHEAGHIVMNYLLDLPIGEAWIQQQESGVGWHGAAWTGPFSRGELESLTAEILSDLAGAGAAAIATKVKLSDQIDIGNEDASEELTEPEEDLTHAARCAGDLFRALVLVDAENWTQHWERVNPSRVMEILREHWSTVESIARYLVNVEVASAGALEKILREHEGPSGQLAKTEPEQ